MLTDINTLSVFKQSVNMQNAIMLCVMGPTDLSFMKLCFVSFVQTNYFFKRSSLLDNFPSWLKFGRYLGTS